MASRLALRIQDRLPRLTASERKLGQLILEQHELVGTHSATELARMAGVSKATTARFFRSLGYTDFEEVKLQAREERNRTAPFQYGLTTSERTVLGRTIGDHLKIELANLTRTFEEMSSERLTRAAELLLEAPRVWFCGAGLEESIARYGRQLLSRFRPNVLLLGSVDGSLAEELAMMGPRDVLVIIAADGLRSTIRAITDYAGTTRVHVIGITDFGSMALVQRVSRVVLPCHTSGYGLAPSHTGMMSVLRLLAMAYVAQAGEAAVQRNGIIESIREELDSP